MQIQENYTRVKVPNTPILMETAVSGHKAYDDASLNPNGRGVSDCRRNQITFLKCKNTLQIGTLNVRTIRLEGKRHELASAFSQHKLDILGIIDHKIIHEEETKIHKLDGCMLITTSAWRNASNAASGGVGILVRNKYKNSISDIKSHTNRIISITVTGDPESTIVVNYAPVEGSSDAEEHFNQLSNVLVALPKHNFVIEMGDFNAHLGEEVAQHSYHKRTNKNGQLLHEHATESNMLITNTCFQKKNKKLWTYISDMNGQKSQVDYILVNKKWRNSIKDVQAYNSFSSLGSDHRIVTAKIKLSLRVIKDQPPKKIYDWSVLKTSDLQSLYTISVKNRYSALSEVTDTITQHYANFLISNAEATEQLIPQRKKIKRKKQSDDLRVIDARKRVQDAFSKYQSDPRDENHEQLQKVKQSLLRNYDIIEEERVLEMIKMVEESDAKSRHGQSWQLINNLTGRRATGKGMIKGKSKEERIKKWFIYFKELLGEEPDIGSEDNEEELPPILRDLDIDDNPFTMNELLCAKKSLREGKSSGPDGIPPEVIKRCDLDEIIVWFANKLLLENLKPEQWSEIDLLPIPKTGNLSETTNYRGIALSSVVAKIVNKLILNRIQPSIDKHLRKNQNGFRPGRSTTAHILALRRLIEGVKMNNRKAIIIFIDFKKAFDSIHRGKMMKILKSYGIPPNLLRAIALTYENTKAKVITPDGETAFFKVIAGVLQGDTLAPYLFAIVLDYVMRQAIGDKSKDLGFQLKRQRSRRVQPIIASDLDFADDIALLTEEIHQAQEFLLLVEKEASKVGLQLNSKKTKLMSYNQNQPVVIHTTSGVGIKEVKNFKYLGAWMQSSEKDFTIRKAIAWNACHKLSKVWKSELSKKIKIRLFVATVETVLLYGAETWTLTKALVKQLDGVYTRMLRMALNVSWREHMTNIELYGQLPKVSEKVAQRRLRIAGHCIRHPEEAACDLVLWQSKEGKTNRGRKAKTYIDMLLEDTNMENVEELRSVMVDRTLWRSLVEASVRPGGQHR